MTVERAEELEALESQNAKLVEERDAAIGWLKAEIGPAEFDRRVAWAAAKASESPERVWADGKNADAAACRELLSRAAKASEEGK
jgi:hypothetical protein